MESCCQSVVTASERPDFYRCSPGKVTTRYHSHSIALNSFRLGFDARLVRRSFDSLIYPYYQPITLPVIIMLSVLITAEGIPVNNNVIILVRGPYFKIYLWKFMQMVLNMKRHICDTKEKCCHIDKNLKCGIIFENTAFIEPNT